MDWYYVDAGKSTGPISEPQLVDLIKTGKVTPDTLLWREGMTEWKPCKGVGPRVAASEIKVAPAAAPAAPAAATETCAQCGQTFPREEMMKFENAWVCVNCKPVFLQKLKEGVSTSTHFVYGGFWIRFLAKFIDGILMGVAYAVIILPITFGLGALAKPVGGGAPNMGLAVMAGIIPFFLNILINVGYATYFVGKYAATPGKMACGLRVVNPDGTSLSYAKACGRYFGEMLTGLVSVFFGIGYLIAAWDDEKRALHDRVCGTRVVRNG